MKLAALALMLLMTGVPAVRLGAQTPAARPQPYVASQCVAQARQRATAAFGQGASREAARRQLEIDAAKCLDPALTPAAAYVTGIANADRARLARDFLAGQLTLAAFRAALDDRRDKLARLLRDSAYLKSCVTEVKA